MAPAAPDCEATSMDVSILLTFMLLLVPLSGILAAIYLLAVRRRRD